MAQAPNLVEYAAVLARNGILDEIERVDLGSGESENMMNYGSDIQLGQILFRNRARDPHPLFIKMEPKEGILLDIANKYRFCLKEAAFYKTILPDMCALWRDRTGNDETVWNVYPTVYQSEPSRLIMDNLKIAGYRPLDCFQGETLKFEECKLALRSMAIQHGTSYVMIKEAGGLESFRAKYDFELRGNYYEAENPEWYQFFNPSLDKAIQLLKDSELENATEAMEVLLPYQGRLFQAICEQRNRPNQLFTVLVHGDLHVANMLFKFDEQGARAVKILDLQTCVLGSPTVDLLYYTTFVPENEIWQNQLPQLLRYYYDELKNVVDSLGEKLTLSYEELEEEYKKDRVIGLLESVRLKVLCSSAFAGYGSENTEESSSEKLNTLKDKNSEVQNTLGKAIIALCMDFKKNRV